MIRGKVLATAVFASLLLFACSKGDFDYSQFHTVKGQELRYSDTLQYAFIPVEAKKYEVAISVRYTDEYEFSNIWWKISDNKGLHRVEMPLFDKAGKPLGSCTGGVCTQMVLWKSIDAAEGDTLNYRIVQNMRRNPLNNISEVGLIINSNKKNQ